MPRIIHERPLFSLLELLIERDIENITRSARIKRSKLLSNPLQEIVINMLLYNGCIIEREIVGLKRVYEYQYGRSKIGFLYGKGNEVAFASFIHGPLNNCLIRMDDLVRSTSKYPLIIIDLKYWDILLKEEQNRLINQLVFSLYAIRNYLWDLNLILTNVNKVIIDRINKIFGLNRVQKYSGESEEFLDKINISHDQVILLDPNAEETLDAIDILSSKVFIIGGIVDRIIPRKGITSTLISNANVKRRKIVLKDSIIGVPVSVNKIVEIILQSRYETGGNIGLAIRRAFSKRDIKWRVRHECAKLRKTGTSISDDLEKVYKKLKIWLPIDFEEFKQICMKIIDGKRYDRI